MSNIITARDASTVAAEIRVIKQQTQRVVLSAAIEIGQRLAEAKEMVPYGEWGNWLEREVDFSQSRANNLMNLYKEYGQNNLLHQTPEQFLSLPYSTALKLLAIPEDEREAFATENNVSDMSVREVDAAVKEYKAKLEAMERDRDILQDQLQAASDQRAADHQHKLNLAQAVTDEKAKVAELEAALAAAEEKAGKAEAKARGAQEKLDKAKQDTAEARQELQKARENPEVPEAVMAQIRAEAAQEAAREAESAASAEADKAKARAESAEAEADKLRQQLEEARKASAMADPEIIEFKQTLGRIQEDWNRLLGLKMKVEQRDPDKAGKLLQALSALAGKFSDQVRR